MCIYLSPESLPPLAGGQVVAVQPDAVRTLDAVSADDAHVVDERQRPGGAVGEPDEVHHVGHHVERPTRRRGAVRARPAAAAAAVGGDGGVQVTDGQTGAAEPP